jgi:glycosyltransferase involved in cell wall biosynthesis
MRPVSRARDCCQGRELMGGRGISGCSVAGAGRMKILWVKANKLLPVHSGGDIRSYNIARQLAQRHELVFLSYYDGKADPDYDKQLREHLLGAVSVCTGKRNSWPLTRLLDYCAHLASPLPYAVSRFASVQVRALLRQWFAECRFHVTVCDFLDAAVNFPRQLSSPSVLFQHNVESEIWRRHASTASNPLKRRIYGMEFRKMLGYEQNTVRRFHHVISVSEHDRRLMTSWVDGSRITVVPTGVDLGQYRPNFDRLPAGPLVVFVGAMDWEPNIDAMEHLCREIWPLLLAQVPDAKLRIVGRNPGERIRKLANDSVQITGRVPSVLEHLHDAAVVVVPLRIGGGTRLKIYEAMAAGKAVVSTSVGAEGLDVRPGRDIILADDPRSFADAICQLLQDEALRHSYERAAAECAARYDWSVIGADFGRTLELIRERWLGERKVHASIEAF